MVLSGVQGKLEMRCGVFSTGPKKEFEYRVECKEKEGGTLAYYFKVSRLVSVCRNKQTELGCSKAG